MPFLMSVMGMLFAINAAHDGDAINDERGQHDLVFIHAKLLFQIIRRSQKEIEPPDAVGEKFAPEKRPGRTDVPARPESLGYSKLIFCGRKRLWKSDI